MKLDKEQIEKIYLFTREYFVEYYDLQTEFFQIEFKKQEFICS